MSSYNMDGHTSQLGPHENEKQSPYRHGVSYVKKKSSDIIHHPLLIITLFSFSLNVALIFVKENPTVALVPEQIRILGALGSDEGEQIDPDLFNAGTIGVQDSFHYTVKSKDLPKLSAESYLVGDIETGEIIMQKNEDEEFPIASVSKLMTAVVAKESLDIHRYATVSQGSYNTYGSEGELKLGEKILLSDLMYPLLIESSNDAAEVIANDYGRDAFLILMNQKAATIGMTHTSYEDPSGLSPDNKSSVVDLFRLGKYIKENHPDIFDMTRVKQYSTLKHSWKNLNAMLSYENFAGGKNGFIDQAKKTTVATFEIPFTISDEDGAKKIERRTFAIVLLRSDDRNADITSLLKYIKSYVEYTP